MRLPVALALAAALAAPAAAQDLSVPKKHAALYRTLDARLDVFQARLPHLDPEPSLLRGAQLGALRCEHAADLANAARWDAALRELEALRRAGAQALALEICYPLLTPEFGNAGDARALLEQYANFANQVRLRDMKLLVQHDALPPLTGMAETGRYYRGMTRQRFMRERYEEAKGIALALRPDYLTLAPEPRGVVAGLRFGVKDWRSYLRRATGDLKRDLGEAAPPLGAGLGVWDASATLETLAAVPGLDYIDLRSYPIVAGAQDLLERLVDWPQRVRAIDPGKRVVLGAVWLYKGSSSEPFKGLPNANAVAREAFGFWSPLDVKFLRATAQAARAGGVELMTISRPRYVFAYLDFFDPATYRASARLLDELAGQRAASAMERGALTDTGRAFGGM
ncbi:MAG TPA: hypothetical protein VFU53_00150 [Burkholderiales bacterium]|nr:hypothetical protein [Burkholderiales bacterium]